MPCPKCPKCGKDMRQVISMSCPFTAWTCAGDDSGICCTNDDGTAIDIFNEDAQDDYIAELEARLNELTA